MELLLKQPLEIICSLVLSAANESASLKSTKEQYELQFICLAEKLNIFSACS